MGDGKASALAVAAFVAFMWAGTHAWTAALAYGFLPDQVVQVAAAHADDDPDAQAPDDPRWYVTMATLAIGCVLAFRVYRWSRAGRWQGDLSPKEFALSWDVAVCAVAALAASIAVSATGLTVPASGILRIGAYAAIAFAGWRLYPWLERRAPR